MEYLILAAAGAEGDGGGAMLSLLLSFGVMIALFYFLLIRPEGKRKKRAKEMLESIQIADEVVTAGGIIGRVIDIKPDTDTVVLETGGNRTRIRILKAYIVENRTVHDE
ncbi:MAG: preprotein translocase subunit YajC [Oscillospiraceae bacterium]|jgi:preprotein translocase subunit YajC|nr:preprotein translocase subunit YajC [Oscillospiraceae bacterium]